MAAVTDLLSCLLAVLGAVSLVSCSRLADVDQMQRNNYESLLMSDLYKRLAQLEDRAALDFNDIPNLDYLTDQLTQEYSDGEIPTVQEAVRDSELIEHSSSAAGNQQMFPVGSALAEALNSGSKSDDSSLPFYCPPPNPCPKGYTEADGCMTDVLDTAESQKAWINAMQDAGYCSCDREHMLSCPDLSQSLEGNLVSASKLANRDEPVYLTGEKRKSLVAKKSPRVRRSVRSGSATLENELQEMHKAQKKANPYLMGEKLRTVAKKG